jgi:hypothetical protein
MQGWVEGTAHEIVAAVADGEVVNFFQRNAALTFADVGRDCVVNGTVGHQQGALLALALAVHLDSDDGENQPFVSTGIGGEHFVKLRVAIDVHVVVLTHSCMPRCRHLVQARETPRSAMSVPLFNAEDVRPEPPANNALLSRRSAVSPTGASPPPPQRVAMIAIAAALSPPHLSPPPQRCVAPLASCFGCRTAIMKDMYGNLVWSRTRIPLSIRLRGVHFRRKVTARFSLSALCFIESTLAQTPVCGSTARPPRNTARRFKNRAGTP